MNIGKKSDLSSLLDISHNVLQYCVDYIMTNRIVVENNNTILSITDIPNNELYIPSYFNTKTLKDFNPPHNISPRLLSSIMTMACGIAKSRTVLRKRQLYVMDMLFCEGKDYSKLYEICIEPLTLPIIKKEYLEISSKNTRVINKDFKEFDYFVEIWATGFNRISIPIKLDKRDKKWLERGYTRCPSYLITKDYIEIRYEKNIEIKKVGNKIGCDPGIKTPWSLSNGFNIDTDIHGYTLQKILNKIENTKPGSKGRIRALKHRDNFLGYIRNQMKLDDVKEIGYEDLEGLSKLGANRFWNYNFAKVLMEQKCEENGVRFTLQERTYRSQRCSSCGWVHKSNRSGKIFVCTNCGYTCDSDINAANNHAEEIPNIDAIRKMKMNIKGFFLLKSGCYDRHGEEIRVPHTHKMYNIT